MTPREPSRTAVNTAVWRAVHTVLDADPKILADPFAGPLAGYATDDEVLKAGDAHPLAHIPWLRTQFALRNRFAEDELAEAVAALDIAQYVILGAGLDSFAYRHPELMKVLDVYEVDHPGSQDWKRARVAELGIEVPSRLHYAPVDFEHQLLTDGLIAAGIDRSQRAFFSWLGVTQYLTRETVSQTLEEIAKLFAKGSMLVVEFIAPATTLNGEEAELVRALAAGAAQFGEPWLSYFTAEDMERMLRDAGFVSVVKFGPEEAFDRYLRGRTDGSRLPGYFRMIKATT
jgi:methyltransferase (TIGR00027 family)